MKRLLILGTATAAFAIVLAGCAGAASDPAQKPELVIWTDATREAPARAYAEAVADDVDVTVELKDNFVSDIALANRADEGWPDLLFTPNPNDIAQFRDPANGFAQPLGDLITNDVLEGYGSANVSCEFDGQTWCLKNDLAQSVLWYDTVIFEELGLEPPSTFDEFATVADELNAAGYLSGAIGSTVLQYGFLNSSGCTFSDVDPADNSIEIDASARECVRVSETLQPLIDSGAFDTRSPFDAEFIAEVGQQGKVAMQIGGSWWGDVLFAPAENWAVPPGRFAAAEMPIWDGNDVAYSGQFGGGIWVLSSHSEYKDEAAAALEYFISDPSVIEESPTIPAYEPALAIWQEKAAASDFLAENPTDVFAVQAQRLQPAAQAVLFDIQGAALSEMTASVQAGESLQAGIEKFAISATQLAEEAGYSVE